MAAPKHFEVIKPGTRFDFIGKKKWGVVFTLTLTIASLAMLILNAYVIPGRGQMLNWSVEFKGGSEIETAFSKPVEANQISEALEKEGFHGVEAFRSYSGSGTTTDYMIRMGSVAALSDEKAQQAAEALRGNAKQKLGGATLAKLERSEGGDKIYLRFDKSVEPTTLSTVMKEVVGINPTAVQSFGRVEDHTYEATLVSLGTVAKQALEKAVGANTVTIKQVSSISARAGAQLRNDGIKAMLGAILLIVIYIGFRFDFRYGPGTIVALLHDVFITVGAFALTYKEFSLTTLAALLTIIGFSMNDTVVVFDRIRENVARYRDKKFDWVVNESINETLSRTILTAATTFTVTLAMNFISTGVIRDFAFAMNVGIVVGTYSSIYVASPILIWLNDKYVAAQKRETKKSAREARRPVRRPTGPSGDSAEA